jgi:hypothetical protein
MTIYYSKRVVIEVFNIEKFEFINDFLVGCIVDVGAGVMT